ncbi:MAG: hypothetical protein AAF433_02635 [Bacteroidota bacterium]
MKLIFAVFAYFFLQPLSLEAQFTSHILPPGSSPGIEIHDFDSVYAVLDQGVNWRLVDKETLVQVGQIDIPGSASDRGPFAMVHEDFFFVSLREGVFKYSYTGDTLASYSPVQESGGGGIWKVSDSTIVYGYLEYDFQNDPSYTSWAVALNLDLEEIYRRNINFSPYDEEGGVHTFVEYLSLEADSSLITAQKVISNLCFNNDDCGIGSVFLRKIAADGSEVWRVNTDSSSIAGLAYRDRDHQVIRGQNGEFYVAVDSRRPTVYPTRLRLIKVSQDGAYQWQRALYDTLNLASADLAFTNDDYIVGLGNGQYDCLFFGPNPDLCPGWQNPTFFKISPDNELIWRRRLIDSSLLLNDDSFHGRLEAIFVESDGSFLLAGGVRVPKPDGSYANRVWLVRTNSEGCVTPDCGDFSITSVEDLPPALRPYTVPQLGVYPNPAMEAVQLDWPKDWTEKDRLFAGRLRLYDQNGRELLRTENILLPHRLSVGALPAGSYWVEWRSNIGQRARARVVKQ